MKDSYLTISGTSTAEFRDRSSKFFAYSTSIANEEEAKFFIAQLWKDHPKARHVCYAFFLGPETDIFRINDDGEPSGTAGKPIYNAIKSFQLEHVIVAVVRYFGGTKLGTSGLINAYKTCSLEALNNAKIIKKYLTDLYTISFEYEIMGKLLSILKKKKVKILDKTLERKASLIISVRRSKSEQTIIEIKANLLGKSEEEVEYSTLIPGCNFTKLEYA